MKISVSISMEYEDFQMLKEYCKQNDTSYSKLVNEQLKKFFAEKQQEKTTNKKKGTK